MAVNFLYMLLYFISLPVLVVLYIRDKIKLNSNPETFRLFGMEGYFGLPGRGKTMCMARRAYLLRKQYGDRIYIMSNCNFKYEDEPFIGWKQLLEVRDKPLVLLWDEIQNDFNSRAYKNFPPGLLYKLTQVRKGHGVLLLYTAQRVDRVEKTIRELTFTFYECMTKMGRYTICKGWDDQSYAEYKNSVSLKSRTKVPSKLGQCFFQTEELRALYNSYSVTETRASSEYMSREELKKVSDV